MEGVNQERKGTKGEKETEELKVSEKNLLARLRAHKREH